ncbi:MAG: hypothetical protein ACPGWM_03025 [Flavobacteriales bacterium]
MESSIKLTPGLDVLVPLVPNYFHMEYPKGVKLVDTVFVGGSMSIEGDFIKLIPFAIDSFRLEVVFESMASGKQVVISKDLYALPEPMLRVHKTECDSMISRTDLILQGDLNCIPGAYRLDVVDYDVEYVSQNSGLLSFSNLSERKQARICARKTEDGDVVRYSSVQVQNKSGDTVDLGGCVVFVVDDPTPVLQFGIGPVIRR